MRRVCAWCQREFDAAIPPGEADEHDVITHGICEACADFFEANEPKSLRRFLNGFQVPILCFDGNGLVITANDAACSLLDKQPSEVEDCLCGEVMECRHARLPGGCGETTHCLGCTLRRTVVTTWETGHSVVNEPTYIDREVTGDGWRRLHLTVSAEKCNDVVLLRIDDLKEIVRG